VVADGRARSPSMVEDLACEAHFARSGRSTGGWRRLEKSDMQLAGLPGPGQGPNFRRDEGRSRSDAALEEDPHSTFPARFLRQVAARGSASISSPDYGLHLRRSASSFCTTSRGRRTTATMGSRRSSLPPPRRIKGFLRLRHRPGHAKKVFGRRGLKPLQALYHRSPAAAAPAGVKPRAMRTWSWPRATICSSAPRSGKLSGPVAAPPPGPERPFTIADANSLRCGVRGEGRGEHHPNLPTTRDSRTWRMRPRHRDIYEIDRSRARSTCRRDPATGGRACIMALLKIIEGTRDQLTRAGAKRQPAGVLAVDKPPTSSSSAAAPSHAWTRAVNPASGG